jgi:formylglycine-generating enzyme required for sulfatase activity
MRPHTLRETLPNGPAFEMVLVEGGRFWRGEGNERHEVQLDDFYLGRTQVTQALWEAVIAKNPSEFPHPQRPVEQVSWYDCVEFCNVLSGQQGYQPAYHIDRERKDPNNQSDYDDLKWLVTPIPGADGYRLPTEAEWEYAARGGRYAQPFEYAGSPNLNETAWWDRNSQDITQPVGLKVPNALGLFDLSGNVWEWVWDWCSRDYYEQLALHSMPAYVPVGPDSGSFRNARGGRFHNLTDISFCYFFSDEKIAFKEVPNTGLRLCRYPAR